jgi:sigma-B regulation protein RsbU (phosphoserine phosphatase)
MNSIACRNLNLPGRYATLFFAELDGRDGTVRYVNAGHNPPLLLPLGGRPELLSTGGLPVGLFQNGAYETGTVTIPPEATLLVYTDGVIEARDCHDEEFGLARLIDLCADAKGNVQQLLSSIVAAVESWSGGPEPADDITLVAVAREG